MLSYLKALQNANNKHKKIKRSNKLVVLNTI